MRAKKRKNPQVKQTLDELRAGDSRRHDFTYEPSLKNKEHLSLADKPARKPRTRRTA